MEEAVIIMSTYNGEKYLREQIDSILSQTGVNLNLVVRDDGSSDNTSGIIREYQRKYSNIHLMSSRNVGCKKSFYKAAKYAFENFRNNEYFAFSDQDDVWLPDKIISGINRIKSIPSLTLDSPAIYFCPPAIVDSNLKPIKKEWHHSHLLNLEEACIAQPCAGCTMVFNRKALELFLLGDPDKMSLHDSWMYKTVLACGGTAVEDQTPHIMYRQHGNNVVGTGSFSSRWARRFDNFVSKSAYRSGQVKGILATYRDYMPESNIKLAEALSYYKENGILNKLRIICNPRFRAKKFMYNFLFRIAILSNRY